MWTVEPAENYSHLEEGLAIVYVHSYTQITSHCLGERKGIPPLVALALRMCM